MTSAAAIGAASAVIVSIFPWMNVLLKLFILYAAGAVLMIIAAFGRMKLTDLLKQFIVLNLITYFVGGLMNSIYYHTNLRLYLVNLGNGIIFSNIKMIYVGVTILTIALISLLIIKLLRWYQNSVPETYEVELVLDGRSISTRGLMDTGNCLHDPIYKRPVMVIENSLMESLLKPEFAKELEEAKHYLEGNELDTSRWSIGTESILRLRFIPYRSVGKSGMLLGIKLDKVLIHTGKETICNEKVTAAFCDNRLSSKDEYHVILHKELL
jgi:stage II sporulation protein GA (sporulation sigma-E factor processing peptidase)